MSARRKRELRAYRVQEGGKAVGLTVAAGRADLVPGERIFVEGLRSGGTDRRGHARDGAEGRRRRRRRRAPRGSRERARRGRRGRRRGPARTFPSRRWTCVLTNKALDGRTLAEAAQRTLRPRRLPQLDPARLGGGQHPRPAADEAQPRRHPARRRHQGQHRPLRGGGRLRRPAGHRHQHGARRPRHPDRRPDRRLRPSHRRRPDHAVAPRAAR